MFQLAEFCRVCLSKTNELVAIKSKDEDNICLNEKLIFINPQLIPPDDQFPKWVCVSCKKQINDAYCLLGKALESCSVLDKLVNHIKATGQSNIVNNEGEIKDLLNTLPVIKQEIEIKEFKENVDETKETDGKKDTKNVLKIRSISSINAIIHSPQLREECILGGTNQDLNLTQHPPKPETDLKNPITVLFNPKNGRIVPIKKTAKATQPVGPPQEHPIAKYLSESAEKYTCDICWKTFRSQVGYTVHKNWHEKLVRTVPGIEYSCEYCPRAPFKTLGGLKRHLGEHSTHFKRLKKLKQKEAELRDGKMELPGVDLRYLPMGPLCGECHMSFPNFGDLNRHRRIEKHEIHKLYTTQKDFVQ